MRSIRRATRDRVEIEAFSAKVDTGFAKENATIQRVRAPDLMQSDQVALQPLHAADDPGFSLREPRDDDTP
ncbi:hypothetical protein [Blastochloris tepida]|uniref:Uncharacterized protein n=1 Tax=Blastochloris tepida TaxID=2233851 RepID=A0A348FWG6_9HYPH|nr:hypothetical protein [Blastochloris tepida]BBF91649.1 hypothetical protein BLTE_03340 [Blastochloris tepida]